MGELGFESWPSNSVASPASVPLTQLQTPEAKQVCVMHDDKGWTRLSVPGGLRTGEGSLVAGDEGSRMAGPWTDG